MFMAYLMDWQTDVDTADTSVLGINGGSASVANGILTLDSGASCPSGALMNGLWPLSSVGGHDTTVDFTAAFDPNPADGTVQMAGVGDGERGVWVGYNGKQLGLRLLSGGQAQVYALRVGQAASADGTLSLALNGAQLNFVVGAGQTAAAILRGIVTSPDVANANIMAAVVNDTAWLATMAAIEPPAGPVLTDSGSGCQATVRTVITGSKPVSQWVYPEQWNGSGLSQPSPILWSNCNSFRIKLCTLGYGSITVYVVDPAGLNLTDLHTWTEVNSSSNFCRVALGPVLSIYARNFNGSASVAVTSSGFLVTPRPDAIFQTRIRPAFSSSTDFITLPAPDATTTVATLQNMPVVDNMRNCKVVTLKTLNLSVRCTSACRVSLYKNPVLSSTVNGQQEDLNSVVLVDKQTRANTSAGRLLRSWTFCATDFINTELCGCWAQPGSLLAFTIQSCEPGNATVGLGLTVTWSQS